MLLSVATDMESLQTYIEAELKGRLKYIALVEKRSVSAIVKELVTTYADDWRDAKGKPARNL